MAGASPTLRQRELGMRLRKLRNTLGLTVDEVGDKLLCSPTKISRMETGARRPNLRDVRDLCNLYGVDQATSAELMDIARQAREQSWWTQYEDLNLNPYIGLEQDAVTITAYMMYYVPALLQTEGYARAIIKGILPKIAPEIHEQRVEARLRRQQKLEQPDVRYRALLDEAVLHRPVGGPEIMVTQLDKIIEFGETDRARVQVIPFDAGAHAAQDSNFVLFEFDGSLSPIVFVESLIKHLYQERKADVDRYREAVEHLRDVALSPKDSIRRIAEIREKYAKER